MSMQTSAAHSDAFELAGRHVVVTGGAGALGNAVVERFRRAGALCHVPVRGEPPPVPAGGADPTGLPPVRYVPGVELSDESSVSAFYASLPAGLWASVHLAGGFAMAPLAATSAADFRTQLEQNLVTAFLCSREAVKAIRRAGSAPDLPSAPGPVPAPGPASPPRGAVPGGRIVQVASRSGLFPAAGQLAYSTSKAALVALTTGLAAELAAERILVNAVAPGTMDTPANRLAMPGTDPRTWVAPAEVAALIVWLASPANARASGATIPVFGMS
jgi:NAD(P)-dependent dehydrogenase (short-subunit alcohol dehydrogenase family)